MPDKTYRHTHSGSKFCFPRGADGLDDEGLTPISDDVATPPVSLEFGTLLEADCLCCGCEIQEVR